MTKEEFKAKVSMAYHGFYPDREEWERFLEDMWQLHLQAASHWISVKDKLPEACGAVLTTTQKGTQRVGCYEDGWWLANFPDLVRMGSITHWMALPTPPAKLSSLERTGKNEL